MTILPITPAPEQIDAAALAFLCLVDKVSVSSLYEGQLSHLGEGNVVASITSDPEAEQQLLLLQFKDVKDNEKASIVLVSRSKAWLEGERTLVFPKAQGGLWKLDCSASNPSAFTELQDVLTYFIKYENRHQMKNTLAMVNPVSCEVTQVVASHVELDRSESESILDEEDFITSEENKQGQKLPVYVDSKLPKDDIDPHKVRKVKLLYHSGNAMVTGSDWIAHALVLAGQALARGITSGGQMLQDKIEPNPTPIRLSQGEKKALEVFYKTTHTATQVAAGLVDMAVNSALSGLNAMVYKDQQLQEQQPVQNASRHFGISALQAAVKVVGGAASAASMVLVSSRDSIVQMIHKKYGTDAGFVAEKTIGSGLNIAETLVYFDARGISRRVILDGASRISSSASLKQPEKEVVFENEWLEEDHANTKSTLKQPNPI